MKSILFLLVLLFLIVPVSAVDWHDDNRLKRVQLNVNNSSVALTDYQMMKTIAYDNDMQTDFDDLLFYNESGGTVPYWIESKTDSNAADVWLKIPSISTTEGAQVWVYYDNSTASSVSSIGSTMAFGEDFNTGGVPDSSKWNNPSANNYVVSGGDLVVDGVGNYNPSIYGKTAFDPGYIFGIRTKSVVGAESTTFGFTTLTSGRMDYTAVTNENTAIIFHHTAPSENWFARYCYDTTGYSDSSGGIWAESTDYHKYEIEYTSTHLKFIRDGVSGWNPTTNLPTHDMYPYIQSFTPNSNQDVDWVYVRKYTATEPTWAVDGEEESYEAPPTLNGTFLYPNSTYSIGYYGKLTSELVYETGFNFSDIGSFNLLTSANMEYLSIDDTNYIPSIDKTAAEDGYMYGNFSLHDVGTVNFINIKTVHNRVGTNPIILGLFNASTQNWHAVNNSSVETVDVEMTYNMTGTDITNYSTLIDNVLSLSVSLNTNGDGNEAVYVDFVEVYIDYEEVPCPSLECVYALVVLNQNNITVLQNDVGNLENNVNNLYLFVLLCTVFLVAALRKRGDQ